MARNAGWGAAVQGLSQPLAYRCLQHEAMMKQERDRRPSHADQRATRRNQLYSRALGHSGVNDGAIGKTQQTGNSRQCSAQQHSKRPGPTSAGPAQGTVWRANPFLLRYPIPSAARKGRKGAATA